MVYAYQFFKTENGADTLNLYEFETKSDFELWLHADLKRYVNSNQRYRRNGCSYKDALSLMDYGYRPIKLKARLKLNINPSFKKEKSHFLNIKPEPRNGQYMNRTGFSGSSLENTDLGLIIRFEQKRDLGCFVSQNGFLFGDHMMPLDSDDPLLRAATASGLIIKYADDQAIFISHLKIALSSYDDLDPLKHNFALVCLKDWSNPHLFSFSERSTRDLFVGELKKVKHSPINAFTVGNFHPVAVMANLKGNIFKGSFKQSLNFMNMYLHHHFFSIKTPLRRY